MEATKIRNQDVLWTTFPRGYVRQADDADAAEGASVYNSAAGRSQSFLSSSASFVLSYGALYFFPVLPPPPILPVPQPTVLGLHPRMVPPRPRDTEPAAKEPGFSISAVEARTLMAACAVIIPRPTDRAFWLVSAADYRFRGDEICALVGLRAWVQ